MAGQDDLRLQLCGAGGGRIEILELEPQKHPVSAGEIRIANATVVMLHVPTMQLHDQSAVQDKLLIVVTPMTALAAKQALIPATARRNIADTNERLGLRKRAECNGTRPKATRKFAPPTSHL